MLETTEIEKTKKNQKKHIEKSEHYAEKINEELILNSKREWNDHMSRMADEKLFKIARENSPLDCRSGA